MYVIDTINEMYASYLVFSDLPEHWRQVCTINDCIEGFRVKRFYSVCLMLILISYWWRSSCAAVPSSSGASSPVQVRLLSPPTTTLSRIRSRTRAQSASLLLPGSVCKHRRFALLKRSYKANQPERNSRQLVVRLIS